jgi:GMP synthase-like glutamine amidotransferase
MTLLVLHHDPAVGLGALATPLDERGLELHHVDVAADGAPDLDGTGGVLALGGQPADGFAEAELDLLRRAVDAEVPVMGLCAGAEALAIALGGEVRARARPEVGWLPLYRTEPGHEDPVAAGWPDGSRALALHRHEVVRLPDDADQLLVGSDGPSLWRVGSAWASPLHLEADAATVEAWLGDDDARALVADADGDPDALLEESRRRDRFAVAVGTSLLLRWVDGEVG